MIKFQFHKTKFIFEFLISNCLYAYAVIDQQGRVLHRKSFKNVCFYLDTLYYNCLEFGKSSSSIQTHDADSNQFTKD